MSSCTITQREAGRLVRAYTARTMDKLLESSKVLDQVLEGRRGRRGELTLVELRNLLFALEEEIKTLEKCSGKDKMEKAAPPAPSAEATR